MSFGVRDGLERISEAEKGVFIPGEERDHDTATFLFSWNYHSPVFAIRVTALCSVVGILCDYC